MIRKTVPLIIGLLLVAAGCSLFGGGGLKAGDSVQGDLDTGVEIDKLIPNAEEVLLVAGIAVEDNWPALEFPLASADEGVSLYIEENRSDPVIVIVDADGKVLAVGDDWDGELDAFVSLDEIPSGARAIVFDATGDDGEFVLEVSEARDYRWNLEAGDQMESFILKGKKGDIWEDLITDNYNIYREDWETCRVIPLRIDGDSWVRIAVESDMDCVMAVMMVDGDELEYVDFDDDTDGMNPGYLGEMSDGDYLCIVNTYNGSEDAEFTIAVTEMDPADISADIVSAYEMGEWYTGEFREGSMVLGYWPEAGDFWGIYPEEQVIVFEFQITEDGEYILDADCYEDTKMAVIDENMNMIDYNDDGSEGLNPRLTLQLAPGHYSALVTPYSSMTTETVDFMYSIAAPIERERGYAPMEFNEYRSSNVYLHLVVDPGETWEIYAESDMDLTLNVVDGAGEVYFSDDDGGNLNPRLEIESTADNAGAWMIDIKTWAGNGINGNVHFYARPVRSSRRTSDTMEIDI